MEIEASVGDIIRSGQKDYRKGNNTVNEWYVVAENGELNNISQTEARGLFKNGYSI